MPPKSAARCALHPLRLNTLLSFSSSCSASALVSLVSEHSRSTSALVSSKSLSRSVASAAVATLCRFRKQNIRRATGVWLSVPQRTPVHSSAPRSKSAGRGKESCRYLTHLSLVQHGSFAKHWRHGDPGIRFEQAYTPPLPPPRPAPPCTLASTPWIQSCMSTGTMVVWKALPHTARATDLIL